MSRVGLRYSILVSLLLSIILSGIGSAEETMADLSSDLSESADVSLPFAPAGMTSEEFESFVDGVALGQMESLGAPGIAVAIYSRDYGVFYKAYGYGDVVNLTPIDADQTIFPIASISKLFTAAALLRAQDLGLLDLDDPVNKHIDFEIPTFEDARPITLRDLTRHEAGFEERWVDTGAGNERDPRSWSELMSTTYPQLIAPPGAYSSYSNYGIALLGYAVSQAAGMPFNEFLKQQITGPLGMTSTSIDHIDEIDQSRILRGTNLPGLVAQNEPEFFNIRTHPAGRVMTTLPDLQRFMAMLVNDGVGLDGQRILSQAAVSEMFNEDAVHPKMTGLGVIAAGKDVGGKRFMGHGGDGRQHHTEMLLSPSDGFGLYVGFFSKPGPMARDYFSRALTTKIFPNDAPFTPLHLPTSNKTVDLSEYAGAYRLYRWTESSIERILQLTSEIKVTDSGRGTLIMRGRLAPGEYVPVDDQGLFQNRLTGEYLYFSKSWDGQTNLNAGTFPFVTAYRLDWVDTVGAASLAFNVFTFGLGGFAVFLIVITVNNALTGAIGAAVGNGLTAIVAATPAVGLLAFLALVGSKSEPELMAGVPEEVNFLLALPFVAFAILGVQIVGLFKGATRPKSRVAFSSQVVVFALFVLFLLFINHWNALGWNYPYPTS